MLENIYYLKTELDTQGIFFCFSGPISQTLLMEIGETLRNKMHQEKTSPSTILKVFAMFVEQAQNIIHYSAEIVPEAKAGKGELRNGILVVGYENGHYYVVCGNMIENTDVSFLREQLIQLTNMSKDELKVYYKEQRRKAPHEKSKGAGLGFIELARRSVTPLKFDFRKIDEKFAFFSFRTEI